MIEITILSVGKNKDKWLDEALKEFEKRLSKVCKFKYSWVKDDKELLRHAQKHPRLIAMDPLGKMQDSPAFSKFLMKEIELGASRLAFIIGGPEGLPKDLRQGKLLSFSKMTLTHQMIRLMLVEQIYRAFEIERGSNYHK